MGALFWTCSTAEVSTALQLAPSFVPDTGGYTIRIFTPRGEEYRRLEMEVPFPKGATIEVNTLLSEILPDAGIRHAQVEIEGGSPGGVGLRTITSTGHFVSPPLRRVSNSEPIFFPKTFSRHQTSILALLNGSDTAVEVVARVVAPGRAPEAVVTLAPRATKLIHLQSEFNDLADMAKKQRVPTYVRVRAKGENIVSAVLLEQYQHDSGTSYRMVTP